MQRPQALLLALVAALALGAAAATAASAAPEWRKGGAGLGTTKVKFVSKNAAGVPTLQTIGGSKVGCASAAGMGEIEAPNLAKSIVITYKGCKSSGVNCTTANKAVGEIVTNTLSGEAVYLDAAHGKAGILMKPPISGEFAKFSCSVITVTVGGQVLGEAKPLNGGDSTEGELLFAQESGAQLWRAIEEKAENKHLTAFGEESGLGGGAKKTEILTEHMTFSAAVELHKA